MDSLTLLQKYAPHVYLYSTEEFLPATVHWYLERVEMQVPDAQGEKTWKTLLGVGQVTNKSLAAQTYTNQAGQQVKSSFDPSSATPTQTQKFYLPVSDTASTYPGEPLVNGQCTAPCYGAVISGPNDPTTNKPYFTDLLYAFFYAYNGASMHDPGFIDTHEGDWEHVILRLGADQATVLGIFFQAHGSSDKWSQWYYPPGTQDEVCYQVDSQTGRFLVYASKTGHASYTSAGEFDYGIVRGTDYTDQGILWDTSQNIRVLVPPTTTQAGSPDWVEYCGLWGSGHLQSEVNIPIVGDKTFDSRGKPPPGPYGQNWFTPKTDGPTGYVEVVVSRDAAHGQKSRVSNNFTLNMPKSMVKWWITGLPAGTQATSVSFTVMEDKPNRDDQPRLPNSEYPATLTNGAVSPGKINDNTSRLYIARLNYTDPVTKKEYSSTDVFDQLKVDSFTIVIESTDQAPPSSAAKSG